METGFLTKPKVNLDIIIPHVKIGTPKKMQALPTSSPATWLVYWKNSSVGDGKFPGIGATFTYRMPTKKEVTEFETIQNRDIKRKRWETPRKTEAALI